jgi:hypothetical protein
MHGLTLSRVGEAKLEMVRTFDHVSSLTMTGVTQRIDNFRGNEQEYPTYLEGEVVPLGSSSWNSWAMLEPLNMKVSYSSARQGGD